MIFALLCYIVSSSKRAPEKQRKHLGIDVLCPSPISRIELILAHIQDLLPILVSSTVNVLLYKYSIIIGTGEGSDYKK